MRYTGGPRLVRSLASVTRSNSEQRKLAKTAVISDDVSGVVSCPKCGGEGK